MVLAEVSGCEDLRMLFEKALVLRVVLAEVEAPIEEDAEEEDRALAV